MESRSRPGEFVYENVHTEERQAWFPDGPAEKVRAALLSELVHDTRVELNVLHRANAVAILQPLPAGWRKVESRTYPGEYVYENIHTLERQAWIPTEPAPLHGAF